MLSRADVFAEALAYCSLTYSHGFERLDDDPVDLVKQVVGDVPSSSALQIEAQVTDRPLPAVNVIVVVLQANTHILYTVDMSCTAA